MVFHGCSHGENLSPSPKPRFGKGIWCPVRPAVKPLASGHMSIEVCRNYATGTRHKAPCLSQEKEALQTASGRAPAPTGISATLVLHILGIFWFNWPGRPMIFQSQLAGQIRQKKPEAVVVFESHFLPERSTSSLKCPGNIRLHQTFHLLTSQWENTPKNTVGFVQLILCDSLFLGLGLQPPPFRRWARGGCQGGLTTEPEEMGQEP